MNRGWGMQLRRTSAGKGRVERRLRDCYAALGITILVACAVLTGASLARAKDSAPDVGRAIALALGAAEGVSDKPSRIGLLQDIAKLQARSGDEAGAQATLSRAIADASTLDDVRKRCEL